MAGQASEKHFISPVFKAVNVLEVEVDPAVVGALADFVEPIRGLAGAPKGAVTVNGLDFFIQSPNWKSDVRWISQNSAACYAFWNRLFHDLGIADHVAKYIDHDQKLVLYSGFF